MVRAIPTRMLYTLIIHLWIPPCDSSNGLRNLYYYITGRFFTSRALGNASACPSPPAPLGDLYQIVIKCGIPAPDSQYHSPGLTVSVPPEQGYIIIVIYSNC